MKHPPSTQQATTASRTAILHGMRRGLPLLTASVLLHLFAAYWLDQGIHLPGRPHQSPNSVEIELRPAPSAPVAETAPQPLPKPSQPKEKLATRPRPSATTPALPPPRTRVSAVTTDAADDDYAGDSVKLRSAPPVDATPTPEQTRMSEEHSSADTGTATTSTPSPGLPAPTTATRTDASTSSTAITVSENPAADKIYRYAWLPNARLHYDVSTTSSRSAAFHGSASITWTLHGQDYTIDGVVKLMLLTALRYHSEGKLDDHGLAPSLYNEKRFNRSETNTHFNRDIRANISFSASEKTFDLIGGAQDRASIIWQLAAIAHADPDQLTTPGGVAMLVASDRDADTWHITALGDEAQTWSGSTTPGFHIVRQPRADTYERQIDIWFAKEHSWYPVHIRQTEKNGDTLDMTLTEIETTP